MSFVRRIDFGPASVSVNQVQCYPGVPAAHYRMIVMLTHAGRRKFGARVPRPIPLFVEDVAETHRAALCRFDIIRIATIRALEYEEYESSFVHNDLDRLRRQGKIGGRHV